MRILIIVFDLVVYLAIFVFALDIEVKSFIYLVKKKETLFIFLRFLLAIVNVFDHSGKNEEYLLKISFPRLLQRYAFWLLIGVWPLIFYMIPLTVNSIKALGLLLQ